MRALLFFFVMGVCTTVAAAQGFDWQTSPRKPYHIPKRYIGLEVGSGYTWHVGSLEYIEQEVGITCCDYQSGHGVPLSINVVGEQWIEPSVSIVVGLGISLYNASFTTPSQSVPLSTGKLLQTEYALRGSVTYVALSGGVNTRLLGTHFTVGAGLRMQLYAGGTLSQVERVLAPSDFTFTENPRSREKALGNSFLDNANRFQVEPYVQIGYDISVSNGFYLSPSVSLGVPLLSVTSSDQWRMLDLGARIRLMKGL
ncbi:MAG: hypothetical protein NTX15_00410 [Candidatus Kapabacteria bacterium]|nr:hypothetical protein [Candidatus Kapabacteria bacterium]